MTSQPLTVILRFIKAADAHDLRHRVLRPHQPMDEVDYPNDRNPDSFHLGAFSGERLIAVGSFYKEKHEALSGWIQWRLRGMAVEADLRSAGVGSRLLGFAVDELKSKRADLLWCHARETAANFYFKHGFKVHGDPFLIEGIGPHFLMYRPP
jgi:predicted GNAT family N-acyltransferase